MQHPPFLCVFIKRKNNLLELSAQIQPDELVERCRQGDPRSYTELYQKYSKAMYNTSFRIVNNSGDAEDILQEAFLDAFNAIGSFAYKSTFGAWLKRIVINKSINALRKRKMKIIDMETTTIADTPEEAAYDEVAIDLKVAAVKKAVQELPNGYRTVLTLHLFEGIGQEEIAGILQVSHVTVRTQYMRARQKLIQYLKQGGLS